jgi:SAM-dependent methyltransferase
MTDWTAGYVADLNYTYGYYSELNPLRIRFAFANAGLAFPDVGAACELGFGQGLSTNIHAAASIVDWRGTDFNPSQASFAREMNRSFGGGDTLYEDSFAELAARPDLPDFDFIALHGIWTWISDENRAVVVDFLRRKLKVGGVLYISYNTMPGWAPFAPMRHLMKQHAKVMDATGPGMVAHVNSALAFSDRFIAANPGILRVVPQFGTRMQKLREQNPAYLAHEYFNQHWDPTYFTDMVEALGPAKLGYACSAHYLDHVDLLNLTADQTALLAGIPDATFRETVRDYMVNQQFRRDYWVRGARRLSAFDQADIIRRTRVALVAHREGVSLKVTGSLGEANMTEAVYGPILDLLADHKPKTIGQIEQALQATINFAQVRQAVLVLCGQGSLAIVNDDAVIARARKQTDKLNAFIRAYARGNADINFHASPVTGGGISLGRISQLFLLARDNGRNKPEEWADFAWQILAAQGQKLIRDGVTIDNPEENLSELRQQAKTFADKQLPVLKALGVA